MRFLLFALFTSGSVLTAQTVSPTAPAMAQSRQATVAISGAASAGCPVAFTARRYPGGGLVQARSGDPGRSLGYSIHLGADPLKPRPITQARITLHGLSGAQVLLAGSDPHHVAAPGAASEEFSISPAAERGHNFQSTVYTRTLTGVQSVELNELTFADGTHWREAADTPCRISPNGFLLVAAHP